jgi:hypothetical protein
VGIAAIGFRYPGEIPYLHRHQQTKVILSTSQHTSPFSSYAKSSTRQNLSTEIQSVKSKTTTPLEEKESRVRIRTAIYQGPSPKTRPA